MSHKKRREARAAQAPFPIGSVHRVHVKALDRHPAALAATGSGQEMRVPGGVPGDVLDVEVEAIGRSDLWTRIVSIVKPSPSRIEPPCPVLDRCGGCPWQPVRYREQLAWKSRMVREALDRPGLEGAEIHDVVGVSPPVGYRTKLQMPVGGEPGALRLGFYAPRSHDLVPVADCVVQHPLAEQVRKAVVSILDRHHLAPYDEATRTGLLRTVLVRVAEGTGEVGAVLVVSDLAAFDWALLAAELTAIPDLTGVWVNENAPPSSGIGGNAVLGEKTVHLSGARRLRDEVAGLAFQRNPMGFFQTNHRATVALIDAMRALMPETIGTLLDLYAGGGLFTHALCSRARDLHLVEAHPDAVAASRATLRDAGRAAAIHLGRAEDVLPRLAEAGLRPDAVVCDPPRAGMDPAALAALAAMAPKRIVLVSCHLKAFVRDVEAFVERGYALSEVRAIDMFPHTPHVETAGLLIR